MTKVCCVTFAKASDIPLAALAARSIPPSWKKVLVVETRDAGHTTAWSEEVWVRDFNRGGNLNGLEACLGIAQALADASQSFEKVMKLDADTLVLDPSFFTQEGLCGIARRDTPVGAYGMAYSIPSEIALKLPHKLNAWSSLGSYFGPEDAVLTTAALVCGAQDNRLPLSSAYLEAYSGGRPNGQVVGHYRNGNAAKRAGLQTKEDIFHAVLGAMTRDLQSLAPRLT